MSRELARSLDPQYDYPPDFLIKKTTAVHTVDLIRSCGICKGQIGLHSYDGNIVYAVPAVDEEEKQNYYYLSYF